MGSRNDMLSHYSHVTARRIESFQYGPYQIDKPRFFKTKQYSTKENETITSHRESTAANHSV